MTNNEDNNQYNNSQYIKNVAILDGNQKMSAEEIQEHLLEYNKQFLNNPQIIKEREEARMDIVLCILAVLLFPVASNLNNITEKIGIDFREYSNIISSVIQIISLIILVWVRNKHQKKTNPKRYSRIDILLVIVAYIVTLVFIVNVMELMGISI